MDSPGSCAAIPSGATRHRTAPTHKARILTIHVRFNILLSRLALTEIPSRSLRRSKNDTKNCCSSTTDCVRSGFRSYTGIQSLRLMQHHCFLRIDVVLLRFTFELVYRVEKRRGSAISPVETSRGCHLGQRLVVFHSPLFRRRCAL